MVEAAAEANEELMDKYLEGEGELTEAEIIAGLRERTLKTEIVPMFCGSAFKNKGVQAMLDGVISCCRRRSTPAGQGHRRRREPRADPQGRDKAPFSALAFKIMTDPFVGSLTFFRVYSGVLNSGDQVLQPGQGQEGAHRPHAADALQQPRARSRKCAPATSPLRWA
jgi:elongation factor G